MGVEEVDILPLRVERDVAQPLPDPGGVRVAGLQFRRVGPGLGHAVGVGRTGHRCRRHSPL
jgi:hypothetical protein